MKTWKYVTAGIIAGTAIYSTIRYFAGGVCRCKTRLDGLVVIITGANSGIGKALAIELAKRGAILILACRNLEKGLSTKREILSKVLIREQNIHVKHLDLTSFKSIRNFSETINKEFGEIYALVNNAGVFYHPQQLTVDGYDVTFQTNYLGHFVLTHYLLKLLKKSEHARIVNVSSEAHRNINVYDLKAITRCQEEFRCHFKAYGVSKLALQLFTKSLSNKLCNTNVIVNSANPGNVETDIYRYFPPLSNPWLYALQWPIRIIIIKRPHQGAQTILHALLTSCRTTGEYYSDCKLSLPSPLACSDDFANEYYNLTLEILDKNFKTESQC